MNELVREIEEDIRRERYEKLWNSFGKLMVGISITVVLVTIGIVLVQDRRHTQATEKTMQMIKAIDRMNAEDFKGAIALLDGLAQDMSSDYYGPAMLRKAQAQKAAGDESGAQKTYETLAAKEHVYGQLAKLAVSDKDIPAPDTNTPFYYTQRELQGWQLMEHGKKDEAIAAFNALYADPVTPPSLRERMQEVLQHLAPDSLTKKPTVTGDAHEK